MELLSALEDNDGLAHGLGSEGSKLKDNPDIITLVKYKSQIYLQLAVLLCAVGLWTNTLVSKNSLVDLKHKV